MADTVVIQPAEKKPNKAAQALDRYFNIYSRGSTVSSEIGAGIGAFLIACCSFLMTTRIVGAAYGNYAGSYLAITLLAFIGTFLMGLVARKPLIVSSNMAIATSLVAMIGAHEGLTYANLMAVTFFSALISLGLTISPLGKKLISSLPLGVRKALPVAVGLYTIYEGLSNSGLISNNAIVSFSSIKPLQAYYFALMVLAVIGYIAFKASHYTKATFRLYGILIGLMWAGGILFFMSDFIGGSTATTVVYERVNLFFATDGAQPYNIALGFSSVKWGALFTEGFNFTSLVENGGNPALLFIKGIIVYTAMTTYSNVGNLVAAEAAGDTLNEDLTVKDDRKALLIATSVNAVAPIMGAPVVTISNRSALESDNRGKTGLSSIVTSIGFFICLFTWIVFALTATTTNGVGMWIEQSETKLAAYVQDVFAFADLMMVLVGATMLKGIKNVDVKDAQDLIPFIATLAGTLFTSDLAFGIALGVIAEALVSLIKHGTKEFNAGKITLDCLMVLFLAFALI